MHELRLIITSELDGRTVRDAALRALSMSYGQFKRAKFRGELLLDGERALANARLREGQLLVIRAPEDEGVKPEQADIPLSVAYEDADILIIDKPAPLPSASSPRQKGATLENAVYAHLGCPDGFVYRPVNRLDKGTSGLMVLAKNAHAQQLMQRYLHSEDFVREYIAVVEGAPEPPEGDIDLPIGKADGATIRREVRKDGAPCLTSYRVLESRGGRSLVRLKLHTGRTHQIRVHMSAIGCPVTGDFLYGTETDELKGRFALHSAYLKIRHPITDAVIELTSPLPPELMRLLPPRGEA